MIWNKLIQQNYVAPSDTAELDVGDPSSPQQIKDAQEDLEIKFPDELIEFYSEIDGLLIYFDDNEDGMTCGVVGPIDTLHEMNLDLKSMWKSFKIARVPFFIIGTEIDGDLFGYMLDENNQCLPGIYHWLHGSDSFEIAYDSLKDYVVSMISYE